MRKPVAYLSVLLKNPNGSMTVEFVGFAPLLIATLVIGFEFGRAFWAYDVITRDVRASVRYLSRNAANPPPYGSNVCPTTAQNIALTGSPASGVDANRHFPWKGVTPALVFTCPSVPFTGYNDDGHVVTMTANVPMTLSLLEVFDRLRDWTGTAAGQSNNSNIPTGSCTPSPCYTLTVSYQARYIGN